MKQHMAREPIVGMKDKDVAAKDKIVATVLSKDTSLVSLCTEADCRDVQGGRRDAHPHTTSVQKSYASVLRGRTK
jgi:hypothetical protein